MKKRIITILSLCLFSLLLVACGEKTIKNKLALVSFRQDKEEDTPSREIYRALEKYENQLDISYKNSRSKDALLTDIDKFTKVKKSEENIPRLILTNGFMTIAEMENLADQNEKLDFVVMDALIDPVKKNLRSIMFKNEESAFLAGYIAGITSKTNKIGYVGFKSGLVTDRYEYGFRAGVFEATKEKKKQIAVYSKLVESLNDHEAGMDIADKMYADGVDVIYQTVGNTGLGVIDSAKKNKKFVIGYDQDQSYLAKDYVLTSTIKNYGLVADMVARSYIARENYEGKNKQLVGLKENAVSITGHSEKSLYPADLHSKAMILSEKIKAGQIFVPFDKETYEDFTKKK